MAKLHCLELINQIPPWDIGRVCVELEKFFRNEMCCETTTVLDDAKIFPMVMNRIFGNESCSGLYITNVVQEPMNPGFSICFNFLSTNGPLFWYFNRLFESTIPFRLPINQLPQQLQSILATNTPPPFYKNLVVRMDITCFFLHLNAFQYFMFHFALYGLTSQKNIYPPTGRETSDRKTETLYLALAAEYFCTYLPRAPPPPPLKGSMKSFSTPPVLCSTTTRKYLNTENSPRVSPKLINPGMDFATSLAAWQARSITFIFLDVWLTFTPSADGMELPSIELLRSIRVLVKQIHAFSGTGSYIDSCPMEEFRRAVALQLRDRIEPFFMSLFDIWPLDGSLIDLIELWLSYIQPWRYLYNRDFNLILPPVIDSETVDQFSRFIVANLMSYTQPIVKLLPRLAQLDFIPFKSPISPKILSRLLKVVSNRTMLDFIRHNEMILYRLRQQRHIRSPKMNTMPPEENYPKELDELEIVYWMGGSVMIDRKRYTPLFSEPVKHHLCQLMEKLCCAIAYTKGHMKMLERQQKKNITVLQYLWQALRGAKTAIPYKTAQDDCDVLESICQWLTESFAIPPFEVEPFEIPVVNNAIFQEPPNYVNRTQHICAQTYLGDPQLLPITSKEIKFLVRALYRVSKKVNLTYSEELCSLWYSDRWWGSLARLMLQPPDSYMERVHLANGFSTMVERSVGPQLSLRFFASYAVVRNVIGAFVVGALVFGSPIYGFLILILLALVLTLLRTIIRF
ncbi:sphingomyelin phosphodiesterase 4 isoform X2 [Anopheles aquasalis]|uniref:sphingomyelin phosphodiesterase 4 isoform X2 n=1 Tax=Anopheles aquasalis TaxID=42839 RepID=UPI00215A8DCD|nr:sphingomyelin phosphodiesterase 4 isoform X2 [Anopheles aquasalis]